MSSPININTPPSFDILRPWLDENGIRVHEGLLPVFEDETGWKIVAERDIGIREVCKFDLHLPVPTFYLLPSTFYCVYISFFIFRSMSD